MGADAGIGDAGPARRDPDPPPQRRTPAGARLEPADPPPGPRAGRAHLRRGAVPDGVRRAASSARAGRPCAVSGLWQGILSRLPSGGLLEMRVLRGRLSTE